MVSLAVTEIAVIVVIVAPVESEPNLIARDSRAAKKKVEAKIIDTFGEANRDFSGTLFFLARSITASFIES